MILTQQLIFIKRHLKIDNNNINILFSLASTYQGIGKFDEAQKTINQILELDPNNSFTQVIKWIYQL